MDFAKVIVANEFRTYREAIAHAIESLNPDVEVLVVDPVALDREVERLRPEVVICSRVTPVVESSVSTWVELPTNQDLHSRVSVRDETTTVETMRLDDLLALLETVRS